MSLHSLNNDQIQQMKDAAEFALQELTSQEISKEKIDEISMILKLHWKRQVHDPKTMPMFPSWSSEECFHLQLHLNTK